MIQYPDLSATNWMMAYPPDGTEFFDIIQHPGPRQDADGSALKAVAISTSVLLSVMLSFLV